MAAASAAAALISSPLWLRQVVRRLCVLGFHLGVCAGRIMPRGGFAPAVQLPPLRCSASVGVLGRYCRRGRSCLLRLLGVIAWLVLACLACIDITMSGASFALLLLLVGDLLRGSAAAVAVWLR